MSDVLGHANRMQAFLDDEVVKTAFTAMEQVNYRAFVDAKDDEARRMAQAKAVVLADFRAALQVVLDAGERERIIAERSERSPDALPNKEP